MMISKNAVICAGCSRLMVVELTCVTVSAESMAGRQVGTLRKCPDCGTQVITNLSAERGPFDSDRKGLDFYFKKLR